MSFAKVVLSGVVSNDPEKRFTPNNHAVAGFNLSVENTAGGRGNNEPFVVKVTCWRNLAEAAATQLHKGDHVLVEGKLLMNSFQGQDGVQKKLFEVEAATIERLPGRPEALMVTQEAPAGGFAGGGMDTSAMPARSASPAFSGAQAQPTPAGHFSSEDLLTEDDIPF